MMVYAIHNKDTDELVDFIELTSSSKNNFEKSNSDFYLKESNEIENPFGAIDYYD